MTTSPAMEKAVSLQDAASDPHASCFVQANAGSGKTHVLVSRIVRLLLRGTQPERILCLTYTRAAAAEMSDRLFDTLAKWIALDDEELIDRIHHSIGEAQFKRDQLDEARRLFTRALETPGGLKVQTIHAFCEHLLQRFPIEAGVMPGFEVLTEADAQSLLHMAKAETLTSEDETIQAAIAQITPFANEQKLSSLLHKLKDHGHSLVAAYGSDDQASQLRARLCALFEVSEDDTRQGVLDEFSAGLNRVALKNVADRLAAETGQKNQAAGARLQEMLASEDVKQIYVCAVAATLTAKGEARTPGGLIAGNLGKNNPDLLETMLDLQGQVIATRNRFNAITVVQATDALVLLAVEIISKFNRLKQQASAYDFTDLINLTLALLRTRPEAAWVLYKLDGGLDHILIDEAQDTSPEQWQIIEALAEEFFAGESVRSDVERTVFAVGDRKQSIYSFQGADPAVFDAQAIEYKGRASASGYDFENVLLQYSFRSSELILQAVDRVFRQEGASKGVISELQDKVEHRPIRTGEIGFVEMWDLVRGEPQPDQDHFEPRTPSTIEAPHRIMADKIATTIAQWIDKNSPDLLSDGRPVKPSDILILVRRRTHLMSAIVEALKKAGVSVAGADRLKLLNHIAIQDLMALGQFCILPDDDLTLAGVLKSPLFTKDGCMERFSEEDLYELAAERGNKRLWQCVKEAADSGEPYSETVEKLSRWHKLARHAGVYEFYATVLSRDGGRRAMLGGLGPEAANPIDAFLQLCLEYEQQNISSMAGFLDWLENTEAEIKRDMDQAGGEVRVMTVHGAKGLEAPIVFLPDTCSEVSRQSESLYFADSDLPVWAIRDDYSTPITKDLKAGARQLAMEEDNRLLYVAMTRARHRLYVCGFVKANKSGEAPNESWYAKIKAALIDGDDALLQADDDNGVPVWRNGNPQVAELKKEEAGATISASKPPDWVNEPTRQAQRPQRWLSPSKLQGEVDTEKGWSSEVALSPLKPVNDTRFRRGQLVHRLLQTLPDLFPDEREAAARRYLQSSGVDDMEADLTVREIMALFDDDRFANVFSSQAQAEVSIAATLAPSEQDTFGLAGQIDRLLVEDDRVLVVDFKTNRPPPDNVTGVPDIYLRQLAAYAHALKQIYPEKQIDCALLWTDAPNLMPVPEYMLDAAWQSSSITTV